MCLGAEMIGAEVSHDRVLPVLCVFVFIFGLLHYDVNVWREASELPWQLASANIASLDFFPSLAEKTRLPYIAPAARLGFFS